MTARKTLDAKRATIEAALEAIRAGVAATRERSRRGGRQDREGRRDRRHRARPRSSSTRWLPLFADDLTAPRDVLDAWADFDARIGLVKTRPDVAQTFDFRAVKCEAPERCHRPGCHRSILVAA